MNYSISRSFDFNLVLQNTGNYQCKSTFLFCMNEKVYFLYFFFCQNHKSSIQVVLKVHRGQKNISLLARWRKKMYIRLVPIIPLGGVLVSTGGFPCHQLQVKRQLVKLAKPITAKKEDEIVLDEAEFALAA